MILNLIKSKNYSNQINRFIMHQSDISSGTKNDIKLLKKWI